jgi:DNA-binding MarR family transcriptional regulator
VLFRLREQEGLSQVDLAELLELQPIWLVRLLDRWSNTAFSSDGTTLRDRRANLLFLTARGPQLLDDLDGLRDSIASEVRQDIAADTIQTGLGMRRDIKHRIKTLATPPRHIAAKR